ncbi:hypothetical protein [Nucisporomicrobium flavum]|uniref:hypothetical protein n=1 Tax=Nucisporomicrobium flavum TaxID=2785915 RepID=UPI0018F79AA8|nr:hypothetical protein [Nucisporomicrobium flavum]
MRHRAALAATALAAAAATLALPGPASAVEPGFAVRITELPATFGAGAESRTLTVVASTDRVRCLKVRWSLVLRAEGSALDQIEVERVEENGAFPVRVQSNGNTARITDVNVDPGQLCRGRTVTARYRIGFDDDAGTGRVEFQPQAFDAAGTLLQQASGQSPVVGQQPAATGAPTETAEPTPTPTAEETRDSGDEAIDGGGEATATPGPAESDDLGAVPASASGDGDGPSLLGPGLIVGAVLVFLGVGLLLRLRMRGRGTSRHGALPTGFPAGR